MSHPTSADVFDTLEQIAWIIPSILTHPVFPSPKAAPPKSHFIELAGAFAAQVNLTRNADFQKMLSAIEFDDSLVAHADDHVVEEALNDILSRLSILRGQVR